jgi:NADPH:quinone reductase-like Zn-dependent oxidoreductase
LAAWNFLVDKAGIKSGQKVLINGASGSVGTAAVQIARHFGAEVTGVCSGANLELVRSLGAGEVIDYSKTDFTRTGTKYDIIFDVVSKSSFSLCKDSLASCGVYLTTVLGPRILFQMLRSSVIGRKRARFSATGLLPVSKRLLFLKELIALVETGMLKSVIDKCYTLEQISEAHRYIEAGRKKGNVIINLGSSD